ncbi:ribonuclease T [Pelagivirga sediminicola]|uniref:Ribonuclease T n=1 Tax=Pelagivirga sediminicola TaxID=2170575 RepID=A0A2T7G555_9RHOB|nr:ribonuclease T2 [Pelagivirga sediminicola]PVA09527.1 ribonuclease T [Pelagivirga sediminicola]
MRIVAILLLSATIARAEGEKAGAFDYYVLALSWTPTWCAQTGDARGAPECRKDAEAGWTLHGLWPQYHRGWPSYCPTAKRPPPREMTRAMSDIMGSAGLAWHQWKKHGRCSGLSARAYFALAREAFGRIERPAVFAKLTRPVSLPARVVEAAFLEANPQLEPDMVTITCRDGRIHEARICLSRGLAPVPCGQDTVRDCRLKDARLDPVR